MKIKRFHIAGVILLACIVTTCFGLNSFIQSVGFLAAGFLFGQQAAPAKQDALQSKSRGVR